MQASYRARYTDASGSEATTIHNDGTTLRMTVRGVEFEGTSFDDFAPADVPPESLGFTFQQGDLCSCRIECEIPLPLLVGGQQEDAVLHSDLDLGQPASNGGIDREVLSLRLELGGTSYTSKGSSGWYEDELLELQSTLPEGAYLKSCIACALSDFSPYGHGLFGELACFREVKADYLQVDTKQALFAIWKKHSGFVQETFLCSEFERRLPQAGYRG